jgi:peptidoglycan/xylan/chitin deacetylase (PgdA/CDA1 family)
MIRNRVEPREAIRKSPGLEPRSAVRWPNDARVVVCVQLVLEQWRPGVPVDGGQTVVPHFPEEAIKRGVQNHVLQSWYDYAGKAGIWRILRTLEQCDVPATGVANAIAVERHREAARALVSSGHEICAHSFSQDLRSWMLSRDDERENIKRCVDIIETTTGYRPVGWVSPAGQPSDSTVELLVEQGFRYHMDCKDDDLPYWVHTDAGRIVAIPNPYDINDITLYARASQPPSAFVEVFRKTFDVLYEEGASHPKMINAVVHGPLFGRPFGVHALREVLQYARSHDRVWFARRADVAEWWWKQYGAES